MNRAKPADEKQDLFRDLGSGDENRRRYALRVLSKQSSPRDVLTFLHSLRPYHSEGKLSAIKLLGRFGDEASVEKLRGMVLDFNPKVRKAAVRALDKLGVKSPYTDEDLDELIGWLEHPSWWVRLSAVKGLAVIKDKRVVDPISRMLLDEDDTVVEAAKHALAGMKKKKSDA